jgi:integration host factor subunit beta
LRRLRQDRLCRRPADALNGRWIDPELNGDLAHAGAPRLTQRSPYGVSLGLAASRATDAACLDRLEALCERGLLRVLHEVVPLMLKSDLVRLVFEQNPHLLLSDVERGVASILEAITVALARGDRVELRDFGIFSVRTRAARTGLDPRSGTSVAVEKKSYPFFKSGKEIRLRLKQSAI